MTWDLVVVGAGAAGLMAAARSASLGRRTLLLEKNRQPGVKILMSGGTRCNITHDTDNRGIIAAYGRPGRFLHSPLAALGVKETLALFHAAGVPTKVEETGKVFPVSDQASDVLHALIRRAEQAGCQIWLEQPLLELARGNDGYVLTTPRQTIAAKKVLLTTGGVSYPGSGTTGDGYRFAANFGHSIVTPRPALTPVQVNAPWVPGLKGLTIPDVRLRLWESATVGQGKQKPLDDRRGSFLFAHFGLSGPVALDISGAINRHANPRELLLEMDFLPTVEEARLADQLQQESSQNGKKQLSSVLAQILPRRLADTLLTLAGVDGAKKMAELSKGDRQHLVRLSKRHTVPVLGTLGFKKAEVTAGGIALDEVHSSTMQSKLAAGLYLAGEVLDLDGPIGGYNFQAAWSTGWLAGEARD